MAEASTSSPSIRSFGIGDDVGGVERVLVALGAVRRRDIVDQPLIERPGVDLALPGIDERVAEAEHFRLLIGDARRLPCVLGGGQRRLARARDQGIYGGVERLGGREGIPVSRKGDVGVGLEDIGLGRSLRQGGSAAERGERQRRTKRPELPHRASPSGQ